MKKREIMKLKELKRTMALIMAVGTLAPSTVYAAEPVVGNETISQEASGSENSQQKEESDLEIPEIQPEVPEVPEVKPEQPEMKPEVPEVKPEQPEMKPEVPEVKPEQPEMKPEVPEVKPEQPEVQPEVKPEVPEVPEVKPEQPEMKPETPEVKPEQKPVNPAKPVTKPTAKPSTSESKKSDSLMKTSKKALRFFTVARRYAFAKANCEIKEEMKDTSRVVGTLDEKGVCFLLKEEGDWYFVESGNVRGFLPKAAVVTGDEANLILKEYKADQDYKDSIEEVAPVAQEIVPAEENKAYFYTMGTTRQTVVEKVYTISTASVLNVREGKGTDSRIIGQLPNGTLCYIPLSHSR